MSKKLVVEAVQGKPYILDQSNDSEVIFSIHVPFKIHSEFVDV
jgi:hypothetical protein